MAKYAEGYAQDRAEIEDLMARYLFAMDYNDFNSYAACFTEDGTLEFAQGSVTGRENIRAAAQGFKVAIAGHLPRRGRQSGAAPPRAVPERDPGGG